jgi:heat shock protein HslJ
MKRTMGLLVLVLAGCVGSPLIGGGTADDLAGTSWSLATLNGLPPVFTADAPTLEFGGGDAGGNSGCNFFGGPYDQDGASLRFGALAATRRACGDSAGSAQETAFFRALESTTRATTSGGMLVLYAGDRVVARFRATDD